MHYYPVLASSSLWYILFLLSVKTRTELYLPDLRAPPLQPVTLTAPLHGHGVELVLSALGRMLESPFSEGLSKENPPKFDELNDRPLISSLVKSAGKPCTSLDGGKQAGRAGAF